jgi:DAK2 domain fusion protein YloV
MSDVPGVRRLLEAAAASLEASRARIDDLNVYPVPDGDTGTNMALTMRALLDELGKATDMARPALAHTVTRAALMGARGNSGVILSQILRGAAEVLGEAEELDSGVLAGALRAASDTAYRGVRTPVEGTILTVIREMAEEAEARAASRPVTADLLRAVLARGETALAGTPALLDVLRHAGVVDAGGAGLVELMRGIVAAVTGEPLREPSPLVALGLEAVHQELSEFRYCTAFVVLGSGLERESLERELEALGDSLLVVGDASALKVHVHTDDPGAALSLGTARGTLARVEIADMHVQAAEREEGLAARANEPGPQRSSDVIAVVAGEGNRGLFTRLGTAAIVEGGQSMNPSTAEILEVIERARAPEAVVLPNNGNVIMSAEQAAGLASKPVRVVPTRSIQAGLTALLAYDPSLDAEENDAAMRDALDSVATAAVTTASRDVELNGLRIHEGQYLGLLEEEPLVGGESFDEVAGAVVEALLASPHDMLTFLTGAESPPVDALVSLVEERHPDVEVDVQPGGQPHYHLLISAE